MIGSTLGPYRIDRELGAGGMGKVYAATVTGRCPGLAAGTVVALKVVHPHLLETPGFFKRFLREAEIGKSVVHENVVRTFDADAVATGGLQHNLLVMENVEGQTLRSLLAELGRVPEELCRHVGCEAAKGLAAIHAAGVVHRDMKPDNVLITADHVVKVMDLGVARLAEESLRLSQSGAFVGSVEYAAPEQFGAKVVGPAADLHALGLVLYELATAQHPYRADDFRAAMRRVLDETPRRCAEINPQLSPFFEEVVHRLLAKRPEDRFASAAELALVLGEGEASAWWKERAKAIRAETKRPLRRIRIPRETALYGRDAEIAKLRALYEKAKAGEGQVVLVEGEAGIGKSRLVDEFVGLLQRGGEDLNFLFGSYPPGGAATAAGAFSTAYREQFGEPGSAPCLAQTPVLVPAFDALLRGEPAPSGSEPLTKDSIQTCFVHATRNLAAERPTIVLIDDLHFAPEEGRALFAALATSLPGHRVLLAGTTRPGLDEKWLASHDRVGVQRMALARLGGKDVARLLIDALKSEKTAEDLALKVLMKSDGNPFFVFEILRGLREGQFLTKKDDGTWVSTRVIADIQIPSSILELVQARVADLDDAERNLLDLASCVGFEFDAAVVADALGVGKVPAMQSLARIEKRHRLVRSAGRKYVFDHHQVEEALYGGLAEPLREEYHAMIARALETQHAAGGRDPKDLSGALCVDLAEHFLKGARGQEAMRYLDAALAHLDRGYLRDAEVRLSERALAVPGLLAGAARAKALLRLSDRLDHLGRRERQEACAREAERIAEERADDGLRSRAAYALGVAQNATSHAAEAESSYRRTQEICRSRGDRLGEAAAANGLGLLCRRAGRFDEARTHYEQAVTIGREIQSLDIEAVATGNLSMTLLAQGRLGAARESAERSLAMHSKAGNRRGEAAALGDLASVLSGLGRVAEAREYRERHLAISREIGHREGEMVALYGVAGVLREAGDAAGSEERYLACRALAEEIGHSYAVAASDFSLGSLRVATRGAEAGRGALVAARELARAIGARDVEAMARCQLALLSGGDAADALEAYAASATRMDVSVRREALLLLWKVTGDRAHLVEAKRLLDELTAQVDEETRGLMLTNVRVNREIAEAAKEAGL